MTGKLPPPFEIGQSYLDGNGEYTVISLSHNRIRTRRADGIERMEDADLKARIHRRILLERTGGPVYTGSNRKQNRSGSLPWFFEIIAEILERFGKTSTDFVTHDELCEALLQHADAGPAIERFAREDPDGNSQQWWAANRIAWWSQRWTMGQSPYDGPFERRDGNGAYDYRKILK
jgi:hypothetical protein